MTTKTHIALFAVALFAVAGMGISPAFAGTYGSNFANVYNISTSDTVEKSRSNVSSLSKTCGEGYFAGTCYLSFGTYTRANLIVVDFGVKGITCEEVTLKATNTTHKGTVTQSFNFDIDKRHNYTYLSGLSLNEGDRVTVKASFADCQYNN